jgi:hypothetical protein
MQPAAIMQRPNKEYTMFQQTNTASQLAELAALRAENARLKANQPKPRALSCKVSLKGAVSIYGFGKFPVTLYKEQWAKLFAAQDMIKAFITTNEPNLKNKGE